MNTAASIALFCAGGGLTRYYLSRWVYNLFGQSFPYGTFVVNIIGAFCIGLIMEIGFRTTLIPATMRVGITVGFMGGLTTFSTFSYETFLLLEEGRFIVAMTNILASITVCLLLTWAGIVAARVLIQGGIS